VIAPPSNERAEFESLLQMLAKDSILLRTHLVKYGGLLLRGFEVDSAERFERVAGAFVAQPEEYVGGVSRRSRIHNNVYNSTHAPADVVIEQHLEATHTPHPPSTILFNCRTPPTTQGETPLASFVDLFDALPESLVQPLLDDRVVYTRHLVDRDGRLYRHLPRRVTESLALSWQEVSGCQDYAAAQARLVAEGYEVNTTTARGLRTRCSQPLISKHPVSGKRRWYLSDQITRKLPWLTRLPRALLRRHLGMDFRLASGRRFTQANLDIVHAQIERLRFSFRWQANDVLVLDNEQMSHGRNPFSGERLILTAFG
jgi:alpha-ketoglutarate-dependent taurine dioxygenase